MPSDAAKFRAWLNPKFIHYSGLDAFDRMGNKVRGQFRGRLFCGAAACYAPRHPRAIEWQLTP